MGEVEDVSHKITKELLRWPGYQHLAAVMNELPDLRIYLAGGALRDFFLQRYGRPKDFDFFLGGPGVDLALSMLESHGPMRSGPFGSPRWYPEGDEYCCDLIPIERFWNGLWRCEDIVDALNQFDFTGNAVAIDLRSGEFYDPQNGRRDMYRNVMRIVRFDYPDEPIAPGQSLTRLAVLWFRVLQYTKLLGLRIEPVTRGWLIRHWSYLEYKASFTSTFFPLNENFDDILCDKPEK